MTDRVTMLNRALLRIGANPLIDEMDPAAPIHLAVYDSVLEHLAAHPFSFFKVKRRLPRLSAAPSPAHWEYAFQLPSDMIGAPRAVYPNDDSAQPTTNYEIVGKRLLASYEEIWLAFHATSGPQYWPGDFRELFTKALMSELALSIREDRPMHVQLFQECYGSPSQNGFGGLLARALENDGQGTPSTVVGGGVNPLIDVRF